MLRSDTQPGTYLLDLSSDSVLQWLIGWVGAEVAEIGYDLYRQDFNMGEAAPPAGAPAPAAATELAVLVRMVVVLLLGLLRTKDIAAALSVPCPPPDEACVVTSADPLAYWLAKDNCSAANASAASSCSGDRLGITEAKCVLLAIPMRSSHRLARGF